MPEADDDGTGGAAPALDRASRRIFTPATWFKAFADVVVSAPVLLAALVRPRTSAALREKVMLGVTSVTDCRYCQWGHSHWALAHGVPLEEINQILGLQGEPLRAMDPAEATAILFAQHYAENLDRFDPAARENLRQYFSDAQVAEIIAYIRAVTFGSLTGNTVDAFLDRFHSPGPDGGEHRPGLVFEGLIALAAAPVILVLHLVAAFGRRFGIQALPARPREVKAP
jgi:AhpD family alkylhydroperoxidase